MSYYLMALELTLQEVQPQGQLAKPGGQQQAKLLNRTLVRFEVEGEQPALVASTVMLKMHQHLAKLYGPLMLSGEGES